MGTDEDSTVEIPGLAGANDFTSVNQQGETLTSNRPTIAVIIPAYNAERYIAETIGSVLHQSRPADEIVVVDDGSTDQTPGVVAGFHPRVRMVRQQNAGEASARQRGLDMTTSELLLFLDADDVLTESALETLSDALEKQPLSGLAVCPAQGWSPTDPALAEADASSGLFTALTEGDLGWRSLLLRNFIRTPGCVLMRRTALNAAGGWDADDRLRGNADWELWLRMAAGQSFAVVPEPLLKYRLHAAGMSKARLGMYRSMFRMYDKQKQCWSGDPARKGMVERAVWRQCRFVIGETLAFVRSSCSKGRLVEATRRCMRVLPIVLPPMFRHVTRSLMRRVAGESRVA